MQTVKTQQLALEEMNNLTLTWECRDVCHGHKKKGKKRRCKYHLSFFRKPSLQVPAEKILKPFFDRPYVLGAYF